MKQFLTLCLFTAAATVFAPDARADSCATPGASGSINWSTLSWSCGHTPTSLDTVTITEGDAVILDSSPVSIGNLTLCDNDCRTDTSLTHSGSNSLTAVHVGIYGGAGSGNQTIWDIADGSATTSSVSFYPGAAQPGRTADVTLSTGTLQMTDLYFYNVAGYEDNQRVIMSSTATLNVTRDLANLAFGDISPGTSSTVTFPLSGWEPSLSFDSIDPTYANLTMTGSGVLANAITTSNVTGNVVISGTLDENGQAITGNSGKTFQVDNGATFQMTGSSSFPTGFTGGFTFGATSDTQYLQNVNSTMSAQTYGHLTLKPSASSTTFTFEGGSPVVAGNLTTGVNGAYTGATITAATNSTTLDVNGDVTIGANSTLIAHVINPLYVGGSWDNNGTFQHNTGSVIFDTSNSGKTIDAGGSNFHILRVDKSGQTITLNSDATVANNLTFYAGTITTGSNKVIIPSGSSISRTSGHVVGNLQMYMTTGATSETLVIGDATNYTPVDVAFGNVSVAGNLTGYATAGDHPDIANSGINSAKSVNRYWSLAKDGTLAFNNYDATFHFVAGDIDGGADYNSFIAAKDTSGVWSLPTVGTKTSTSTQVTGITAFSDFQLGEAGGGGGDQVKSVIGGSVTLDGNVVVQ